MNLARFIFNNEDGLAQAIAYGIRGDTLGSLPDSLGPNDREIIGGRVPQPFFAMEGKDSRQCARPTSDCLARPRAR